MTAVPNAEEQTTAKAEEPVSLLDRWPNLTHEERITEFKALLRTDAEDLFLNLHAQEQSEIYSELTPAERRSWIRLLAPDDVADLIQLFPVENRPAALALLDDFTRTEVVALLAYSEDEAGGLMSSRFIRLRPEMAADEAIHYLRAQMKAPSIEVVYYAYVMNASQTLLGAVSFRQLMLSPPTKAVRDIMTTEVISIPEDMDQEEVSKKFAQHDLMAIPVVDGENRMKGIITFDDVVDVVKEEATEDMQKIGAVQVMDLPYLRTPFLQLIQKRAGWLIVLFIGEMFTATAIGYYESEIAKAVVLALFIPLIISSGGNSGSQASTLIIRSLALGEVRIEDWWKILKREILSGLVLGSILGLICAARIYFWPYRDQQYGEHYVMLGFAVSISVLFVVLWGATVGSMLPLALRKLDFDPATASAPLVATLVDVTGLLIYFTVARVVLAGALF